MSVLCDRDIRKLCDYWSEFSPEHRPPPPSDWKPMLEPFSEGVSGGGVISYGLTSAGYDLRLAHGQLMFRKNRGIVIDPKRFKEEGYSDSVLELAVLDQFGGGLVLPPHAYVLGQSVEYIRMPRWLKGHCVGKSTYARCCVLINTTPLEPGWHGTLTIEIGNVSDVPVMIYPGEGIAQLEFHELSGEPAVDYAAKGGKYQGQTEVTPARVK